jgi:hypothetical protein
VWHTRATRRNIPEGGIFIVTAVKTAILRIFIQVCTCEAFCLGDENNGIITGRTVSCASNHLPLYLQNLLSTLISSLNLYLKSDTYSSLMECIEQPGEDMGTRYPLMKDVLFWDMKPCGSRKMNQHF